jgi:hemerythrin-like domain-containing protein
MKPIGPLMWEHRLIERMVGLIGKELGRLTGGGAVDTGFIDAAVDFFRSYADRTHHGKEEDILFKALDARPLAAEHRRIMEELKSEHRQARELVGGLNRAGAACRNGDDGQVDIIVAAMRDVVDLYPKHIEKEDKHFFFPVMEYFDQAEQGAMLQEFWEFDRGLIHERYRAVVDRLEKS